MNRLEPLLPDGFAPVTTQVDFSAAPLAVVLKHGAVELRLPGETLTGSGDILFRFLPTPRVCIESRFQRRQDTDFEYVFVAGGFEPDTAFVFDGQQIEGFSTRREVVRPAAIENATPSRIVLDWNSGREPMYLGDRRSANAVSAILHLFNFPKFRAGRAVHLTANSFGALLILESNQWRLSIQGLPDGATDRAWKQIEAEGGCYLTHVAKLERKDGAPFSVDEFEKQREMLASFLSFIKGRNYKLACSIGLDADGRALWQGLDHPPCDGNVHSWFSVEDGQQAEALFPLFVKRWYQSEEWKDCLRTAIHWYTQTTTDGGLPRLDAAIILAQAALERLAHHHLVVDRRMISASGLDQLRTSDRLRLLFSSLSIPIEIGAATPDIQKAAQDFKWVDAPHAMTDIRNELVHPVSRKQVGTCIVDAWNLSLWYLELSVLALCGHDDTYTSRLTAKYAFQSEKVPWGRRT